MSELTAEEREAWRALARELHVEWCLDGEDDGSEPDWRGAESCHAFAWSVMESDWLAAHDERILSRSASSAAIEEEGT